MTRSEVITELKHEGYAATVGRVRQALLNGHVEPLPSKAARGAYDYQPEQPDGSVLQFLEPLVFQAKELSGVAFDDRPTPGVDAAEVLLTDLLSDGPQHFRDLLEEVAGSGLSRMTLVRAGRRLGVSKAGGVWSFSGGGR